MCCAVSFCVFSLLGGGSGAGGGLVMVEGGGGVIFCRVVRDWGCGCWFCIP